jgi:glycosyltransferase involved in cell wall biosynthesis
MQPIRICFSSPMARPVFEPSVAGPFGGSELRAFTFATVLAQQGLHVDVVVQAHGRPAPCQVHGVQIWYQHLPSPLPRWRDEPHGARRLLRTPWATARRLARSLYKRWQGDRIDLPQFDRLLAGIRADVYACFGVHQHAASVIHTASKLYRPSLLLLASDTDLSDQYRPVCRGRNAYRQRADVCYFALRQATVVVAQTTAQQRLLWQRFGRRAVLIRNPLPPVDPQSPAPADARWTDVLWIGRADDFSKRADLAIELARRCRQLSFTLIMNPRDRPAYQQLLERVPENARVIPHVPWRDVPAYFRSAGILLNTSDAEGFPNSFLQAAQFGVPIVSRRVDPDGMLTDHGCGLVAGDNIDQLASRLQQMSCRAGQRARFGAAGQQYVPEYHDAEERCLELKAILEQLVSAPGTTSARRAA